ncbi:MAG TPA: methyltransferase domain-containing protein [Myxococcales bacterium]|jgi:SAM-dependent methyltransferase
MAIQPRPERPNETWWMEHGGEEWRKELERRRAKQRRYAQQETFLRSFFEGLQPARVLDYGCGFGRHERYLRSLEGLEVHGCDISTKMLREAESYLGDPRFAAERLRLLDGGPLPYPDKYFDIAFTSEVLIHVDPKDFPAVLSELQRVTHSFILHVENVRVEGESVDCNEHGGCWLHDFRAAWKALGVDTVRVLSSAVEQQDVYLVPLTEGSSMAAAIDANAAVASLPLGAERAALAKARHELEAVASERNGLKAQLQETAERTEGLRAAVDDFQSSATFKLVSRARSLPLFPKVQAAARRVSKLIGRVSAPSAAEAAKVSPAYPPELSFGGFATQSSAPSPEALVAQRPRAICICHPDWRGIRAATYGQGEAVLEVPGVWSQGPMDRLVEFLGRTGARNVVVNGVPPGMLDFAKEMARRWSGTRVSFVFHGSTAQHVTAPEEAALLDQLAELACRGVVAKVGFVKAGLAEYFRRVGVPAVMVMNKVSAEVTRRAPAIGADGRTHIGVFVPDLWHKNINTQLVAAASVPGAVVHCLKLPPTPYLRRSSARFVEHGMLPHHEFLALLGSMQANLYVSLTECFPMTVLESIAAGVPCVTSHSSALFDDDPSLFRELVVTAHDNPEAILERTLDVLARRDEIVPRAQQHLLKLNELARQRWEEFLA